MYVFQRPRPSFDINMSALREGQRGAVNKSLERIRAGEKFTSIVLPTRYGKSDVQRITASLAFSAGLIGYCVSVSPTDYLRAQMADADKWEKARRRYAIPDSLKFSVAREAPMCVQWAGDSGAFFLSTTIQTLWNQRKQWMSWIEHVSSLGGRPLFAWDEVHLCGIENEWGSVIADMSSAGALSVVCTATADREDGTQIPGFIYNDVICTEGYTKHVVRPAERDDRVIVETHQGTKDTVRVRSHWETSYAQAFEEIPSPLCKMQRVPVEVDLRKFDGSSPEGEAVSLSAASDTVVRRVLSKVVRDADVMASVLAKAVEHLRQKKRFDPRAQLIVFCSNDEPGNNDDHHCREAEKILRGIAPELVSDVVTNKSSEDCRASILRFAGEGGSPGRTPAGDVLITKQVVAVGVDLPFVKVMADLSSVRAASSFVQRLFRTATPEGNLVVGDWVGPDDPISKRIFEEVCAGGIFESSTIKTELVSTVEKDRGGQDDRPEWTVDGTRAGDVNDSVGNMATPDVVEEAKRLLTIFPHQFGSMTLPEIAARLIQSRDRAAPEPERPESVDEEKARLRNEANKAANEIAGRRIGTRGGAYDDHIKSVWRDAQDRVPSYPRTVSLKDLGVEFLRPLVSALRLMRKAA